jgi:hypothetical protein
MSNVKYHFKHGISGSFISNDILVDAQTVRQTTAHSRNSSHVNLNVHLRSNGFLPALGMATYSAPNATLRLTRFMLRAVRASRPILTGPKGLPVAEPGIIV